MKNKYLFVTVLLAIILVVGTGATTLYVKAQKNTAEEEQMTVVTSFYPMYIATKNVIGDCEGVSLSNLSEPQTGCMHDYQLTAEDMKLLSTADVFVVNGGGIESFLTDVAESYPDLTIINACENLELPGENAHAWMSLSDYAVQVDTIAQGLETADPSRKAIYKENSENYIGKVNALKQEAHELEHLLPGQHVVLFHEAYEYLAEDYGFEVAGLLNLDEERQVSAGEVAEILSSIKENHVSVILAEELYGKDMGDMMQAETGVKVVYLDTLVRGDYEADSYLKGMERNIHLLKEAFQ